MDELMSWLVVGNSEANGVSRVLLGSPMMSSSFSGMSNGRVFVIFGRELKELYADVQAHNLMYCCTVLLHGYMASMESAAV